MKEKFLVLTKKKSLSNCGNEIFLSKFYCGYDYDFSKNNDVLIEENLDADFFIKELPEQVEQFAKKMTEALQIEFNKLHNLNYSKEFWQRILSQWLQKITFNIFCKYYRLEYLIKEYSSVLQIKTTLLSVKDRITTYDITDYWLNEQCEKYDFQLWSKIIESFFAKDFVGICYEHYLEEAEDDRLNKSLRMGLLNRRKTFRRRITERIKTIKKMVLVEKEYRSAELFCLRLFYEEIYNSKEAKCYLYYPGFQAKLFDKIVVDNKKYICALPRAITDGQYNKQVNLNKIMRSELQTRLESYFSSIMDIKIMRLMIDEIPLCFLENFNAIRGQYARFLDSNIRYILSQHGYLTSTSFLFYAEEMHETKHVEILGMQHGGNYELVKLNWNDIQLTDRFYTWGNKSIIDTAEAISAAPYKLETYTNSPNKNDLNIEKKNNYLLFVGTAFPPYLICLERQNLDTVQKIDRQIEFFSKVSLAVKENLLVREFNYEYGWNIKEILKRRFDDLCFDEKTTSLNSFFSILENSSICICDHLGTTWLEALAINKPFILTFEKDAYVFFNDEKYYLDLMERVGILHYEIETAATLINEIFKDVEFWWNDPIRKQAVSELKKRYWNEFGDPEKWWLKELGDLVK
ncbi:putative transferase, LIC12162 family [Propionispira arboris]|uniref:Putative transferase, LIC12162 family n=1 Tax=Propionispira arboris TaxID=84035 RepID=A0A1H7CDV3_9FIRM|nr:LIC12162 family protein [Propionispira arboris]SEJ87871.1 putative transferase, LIC12162 family [Propionispira arboris]